MVFEIFTRLSSLLRGTYTAKSSLNQMPQIKAAAGEGTDECSVCSKCRGHRMCRFMCMCMSPAVLAKCNVFHTISYVHLNMISYNITASSDQCFTLYLCYSRHYRMRRVMMFEYLDNTGLKKIFSELRLPFPWNPPTLLYTREKGKWLATIVFDWFVDSQ